MTTTRRVAALYDIHGNLPALEAVLADVAAEKVDHIVVGGDVFPGPMGVESLRLLQSLSTPLTFIRGNGDRELITARGGEVSATVPPAFREVMHWCAAQLPDLMAQAVRQWPATATITVDGLGEILFCHETPNSDTALFTRRSADLEVEALFATANASTIVCGHTHMQFDRTVGAQRIVNAGSIGMPFGRPGAYWALFGATVELRQTAYDLDAAAGRIRASGYPQAREFAESSVLHPPSEAEMLARFTPSA